MRYARQGNALALVLLAVPFLAGTAAAQSREFRILNGTQNTITGLRYRTPGNAFPPQSAMAGQVAPGAGRRFGLDSGMPCVWDLRVDFAGAEATTVADIDFCRSPELRIAATGLTDVVIRDRSPQDITSLQTRLPGRGEFGQSILREPIRAGQVDVITIPYATSGCMRDLRVRYADGHQQTRRRVDLCALRELEFDTPGRSEYYIENQSSQPIIGLFTRSPNSEWGEVRGLEPISPRGMTSMQGNVLQTCIREFRAVFANRQEVASPQIDVCAADRIAIGADGIAAILPQGPATTGPAQPPTTGGQPSRQATPQQSPQQQPPPQQQQQQAPRGPIAGPPAGPRVATISNTWHIPLRELYLRIPGTENRGAELLGDRVLQDRQEINVPLPGQACRFDVVGVYGDEYGFTVTVNFPNADLCQMRRVDLNGPASGTQLGGGTGFYATRGGLIVTNRHVTRMCNSVRLQAGGASVPLEMIVDDPVNDLAVLRGPSRATPAVTFRVEGQPARLGEQVLAIGYPIGAAVGNQVFPVSGSISAVAGRQGRDSEFSMTAPINPGHSGGPVFDESGLLVGVAVAGITRIGDRAIQNVNFGIRASVLRRLLRSINAEVEEAPPGQSIRMPDLIDRSLPLVLNLACYS